jgi:hypothetical protein
MIPPKLHPVKTTVFGFHIQYWMLLAVLIAAAAIAISGR